jgi:hypothetical protein
MKRLLYRVFYCVVQRIETPLPLIGPHESSKVSYGLSRVGHRQNVRGTATSRLAYGRCSP